MIHVRLKFTFYNHSLFEMANCLNSNISNIFKLRVFISFTKQFFTFHSNRVKCEKLGILY